MRCLGRKIIEVGVPKLHTQLGTSPEVVSPILLQNETTDHKGENCSNHSGFKETEKRGTGIEIRDMNKINDHTILWQKVT